MVSKLHVSLPSHYWLQHRTDSWYTCSIRESEPRFPVTDQWTTMHTLAFCLYLCINYCYTEHKHSNNRVNDQPKHCLSFLCMYRFWGTNSSNLPAHWSQCLSGNGRLSENVDGNLMFWPNINRSSYCPVDVLYWLLINLVSVGTCFLRGKNHSTTLNARVKPIYK